MFDSQFEEFVPTPTQFPKTDINFYMLANNSSALEPWNKTTYKLRSSAKMRNDGSTCIKKRNLSYEPYEKAVKMAKRRSSTGLKHQVTLSTLTFHLQAEGSGNCDDKSKKKPSYHSVIRSKRHMFHSQLDSKPSESAVLSSEAPVNRGFTNSLRHANLLKLKQDHQNKLKELMNRKQLYNKFNGNYIRLNKVEWGQEGSDRTHSPVNLNNIVLGQEPRVLAHDYMRKPKKVSYVGIRKILGSSGEKES